MSIDKDVCIKTRFKVLVFINDAKIFFNEKRKKNATKFINTTFFFKKKKKIQNMCFIEGPWLSETLAICKIRLLESRAK